MKQSTKKTMISVFIILTFAISSLAFFQIGATNTNTNPQVQEVGNPVVDGELNEQTELFYINQGFTIVKMFYDKEGTDPAFDGFINQIPRTFVTNSGQTQVIVEKIQSNVQSFRIVNYQRDEESLNLTQENLYTMLCENIVFVPVECALGSLDLPNP